MLPVILTKEVDEYLATLRREPDEVLAEMEAEAQRDWIPVVPPETGELLGLLARMRGASRVVEIGTAIGVSTLYIARALPPDGQVVSFEIDPTRHQAARDYLQRAGVLDRTDLRLQDAREGLASLEGPFDMAFIDAAKMQYGDYIELLLPLLAPGRWWRSTTCSCPGRSRPAAATATGPRIRSRWRARSTHEWSGCPSSKRRCCPSATACWWR